MAAGVMHKFKLNEISAVVKPAQKHAGLAIIKRDGGDAGVYLAKGADESPLPEHVETYLKRDFSDDKRKELASTGAALPDGSFPIQNRSDLRNAVRALGRAKNGAKAKAHIISRARSLGAMSSLPDDWQVTKFLLLENLTNAEAVQGFEKSVAAFQDEQTAAGFDADQATEKCAEFANILMEEVGKSVCALRSVAAEIGDDAEVVEKDGALQDSFLQFKAHLKGIIPEGIENGLVAASLSEAGFGIDGGGALTKRETDMGFDIKKSLGLAATATDADVEKALADLRGAGTSALAIAKSALKMSGSHLAYLAKAKDDKKKPMPEADCEKFLGMSDADRDAYIKANPVAKAKKPAADAEDEMDGGDDEDTEKCLKVDGAVIRKSEVGDGVFAILKSQQAAIEKAAETEAVSTFTKRADDSMKLIGKSDELATLLRSVQKSAGNTVAEAVAKKFEQLNEVIKKGGGKLFLEVGKGAEHQAFSKAADQIETLAKALMADGKAKNIHKAKDMVRQSNPELKKQEDAERAEAKKAA